MGVLSDWQIKQMALEQNMIEPFAEGQVRPGVISYGTSSYGYDVRCGYKFQIFSPINATVIDPKNFDKKAMVEVDVTPKFHEWVNTKTDVWQCAVCDTLGGPNRHPICGISDKPDHVLIPPHSFALAESIETFNIPRDLLVVVMGKSTYARCGIIVNVTPGEPEWRGKWTIEVSNTTPIPAKIYAGEGLMQAMFLRADQEITKRVDMIGNYLKDLGGRVGGTEGHLARSFSLILKEIGSRSCETSYADKRGKYQDQPGLTPPKVQL